MSTPAELAAATPADRDRYIDFLRVFSLATVILGHWLMAVVLIDGDRVSAGNALAIVPELQPITWLLQVMPLFFFVGGFSHSTALRRSYGEFARARAARLLTPMFVFIGVWMCLSLAIELTGRDAGLMRVITRVVAQPLWFIGVYLAVVALAPAMLRLHKLYGRAVPAVLVLMVAAVDVARFDHGMNDLGYLNLALVWVTVHQLGFCYADGLLTFSRARWMAIGGLVSMVALISFGPYPVSMVGMPGERISNMSPPTVALLAHSFWIVGLALLLRGPVSRMLRRPKVWIGVIAANGLAMTAFLWHLTALFVLVGAQLLAGLDQPRVGGAVWWLTRPVWLVLLAVVAAGLVRVFQAADRSPELISRTPGAARAAFGMALAVIGVLGISVTGFGGPLSGRTANLVFLPMTPPAALLLIAAGALLLGVLSGRKLLADRPVG